MTIQEYIKKIGDKYRLGNATEHTYRGDLERLISSIATDVVVTNEPSRIACGAPDYIITKNKIPIGYIEAKDVGKDLGSKEYKEQFDRYKKSLNNLIITDYLDFQLFLDGKLVTSIKIADVRSGKIVSISENFEQFTDLITEFCTYVGQTIKSASKLSKMMASKAKMLESVIEQAVTSDEDNEADSTLKEQMKAFKEVLIHDIKPSEFADIYAQTIAYGMFAARLHDPTLDDFSRQEAAALIPQSNPFLRKLFQYIAGYDLDERISWIVDALAEVFKYTDVAELLKDFGSATQQTDPMIHFYETFLAEYNPKLRKSRGVYYTPEPVVNFIVRAVDDILKNEFGLSKGLADTSTTTIKLDTEVPDKRSQSGYKQIKKKVHKVQILDPAVGTGTFLTEIIKHIYQGFEGQQGIWSKYVEDHLIPRLNGFEILMASYSMAHLKLELLLQQTGFKPKKQQRLRVFLTNTLEEHHPETGTLFANWLSTEASEANHIKQDTPVMVMLGNPPYNKKSKNKTPFILDLIEIYKYVDGQHFKEKKHWLNDDYVKFIRYSEWLLNKTGTGILAFINNNGFLKNPTFRGMRQHLEKSFNKIYIIDLFGGGNYEGDENVFDIKKSVSINIFISDKSKEKFIKYYPLTGSRQFKYDFLYTYDLNSIKFLKLKTETPYYFFKKTNISNKSNYYNGFKLDDLFTLNGNGMVTGRDELLIKKTLNEIYYVYNELTSGKPIADIRLSVQTGEDSDNWQLSNAINDLKNNIESVNNIHRINYRPFDIRYTYFTGNSGGFMARPIGKLMSNYLQDNIGLVTAKRNARQTIDHFYITKYFSEAKCGERSVQSKNLPLYIYNNLEKQLSIEEISRTPNLNTEIVNQIAKKLSLSFTSEKEKSTNKFAPIDILDYIYAVLHSPTYRKKYKEFLKIDFPRVPYPNDKKTFWKLVKIGSEIRQIHLLESPKVEKFITIYPVDGDNTVTRRLTKTDWEITNEKKQLGRIWINDKQYFDNIPVIAWEFYIGGYQPAQKWLKDRRGRELSVEDVQHYQKIIVALTETDRLMKEVDKAGIKF